MIEWLLDNWQLIAIPVIAFLATCIVGLWLRRVLDGFLARWEARTKWEGRQLIRLSISRPILFCFLYLGVAIGVQVSVLSDDIKGIVVKTAGSLFTLTIGWTLGNFLGRLLKLYMPKVTTSSATTSLVINILRIAIIFIVVLIVLDIWGIPTTPILLVVGAAILVAALALRNAAPNFFAGLQIIASQSIKTGDYIKLESGEEGYVLKISWSNTRINTIDNRLLIIPNNSLIQNKVINYGQPLKQALEPFHFYTRMHLTELTGLRAKNLREFVVVLKEAPDAVIYYHTHHFLEEYHYLTQELSNDFAIWITDALGDEVLGERIASVNPFEFTTLGALRERLVGIIEEHLLQDYEPREAMAGREFYFMKSVAIVLPTPYQAHDLREFIEILRKCSIGTLYYHVFESRLKLGGRLNDFSIWLRDSLDEEELSEKVARFDPFTYSMEGLRLALTQLIEKRIQ